MNGKETRKKKIKRWQRSRNFEKRRKSKEKGKIKNIEREKINENENI